MNRRILSCRSAIVDRFFGVRSMRSVILGASVYGHRNWVGKRGFKWPQVKMFGAPKSMAVFVVSITLAVRTMSHLFVFAMDTRQRSNVFVPNWCGRYRPRTAFHAWTKSTAASRRNGRSVRLTESEACSGDGLAGKTSFDRWRVYPLGVYTYLRSEDAKDGLAILRFGGQR